MKITILGTERSGLSLISGILNASPETSEINPVPITQKQYQEAGLGILNWVNQIEGKKVWLVRHPIINACSLHSHFGTSAVDALQYWYDVNVCLWYLHLTGGTTLIKFEDFALKPASARQAFADLGLTYSKQYLTYGDFDQPGLEGEASRRRNIDFESVDVYRKDIDGLNIYKKYAHTSMVTQLDFPALD